MVNDYIGTELELFQHAKNWKAYYGKLIKPFLGKTVIEVGAGLGVNTALFYTSQQSWICVEPDSRLADRIRAQVSGGALPNACSVVTGTLADMDPMEKVDSLLYVDVLEHIEDHATEVRRALEFLRPGGHLIIMGPAHPFLFSPFDASIGHFRRYTKSSLRKVVPASLLLMRYLDSLGLLLSLGNRVLLKQKMPTLSQILFWDKRVVPLSRKLDPLLGYSIGKSVLGVWSK